MQDKLRALFQEKRDEGDNLSYPKPPRFWIGTNGVEAEGLDLFKAQWYTATSTFPGSEQQAASNRESLERGGVDE